MIRCSISRLAPPANQRKSAANNTGYLRLTLGAAAAVLCLFLIAPFAVGAAGVDRIVAIVNGEIITGSELQAAVEQSGLGLFDLSPDLGSDSGAGRNVLEQLILQKIQLQLARKQSISTNPEEVLRALEDVKRKNGLATDSALEKSLQKENLTLDRYRELLRDQITILKLINREVKAGVVLGEVEINAYYVRHADRYLTPTEYHLRQIFLPFAPPNTPDVVQARAHELERRLQEGADFQALLQQHSATPDTQKGGDLGYMKAEHMLPEIRQAVLSLKPGEISGPVRTETGIHIFRVEEIRPSQPLPLDKVRGDIQSILYQERSEELYERWLKELRNTAQVDIKF